MSILEKQNRLLVTISTTTTLPSPLWRHASMVDWLWRSVSIFPLDAAHSVCCLLSLRASTAYTEMSPVYTFPSIRAGVILVTDSRGRCESLLSVTIDDTFPAVSPSFTSNFNSDVKKTMKLKVTLVHSCRLPSVGPSLLCMKSCRGPIVGCPSTGENIFIPKTSSLCHQHFVESNLRVASC